MQVSALWLVCRARASGAGARETTVSEAPDDPYRL